MFIIYYLFYRIRDLAILAAGIAVSFAFIKSSKNSAKEPVMRVLIGFFGMLITRVVLMFFIRVVTYYTDLIFDTRFNFGFSLIYNIPILGNAKRVLDGFKTSGIFIEYEAYGYMMLRVISTILYAISTAIEVGYFYLLATKPADEIIPVVKTYVDKLSNKLAVPTVETPAVEKEEKPTSKAKPSKPNDTEALLKYKKLLDVGAITQEEFDQKKKEIMERA